MLVCCISSGWDGTYLCCSSPSRSKLLRGLLTQSGDSCGRARLGRLLHQVSLSRRPGRRLLGGEPSCHLFPPQKLHTTATVHPAKLIHPVSRGTSCLPITHTLWWLISCTPPISKNMLNPPVQLKMSVVQPDLMDHLQLQIFLETATKDF